VIIKVFVGSCLQDLEAYMSKFRSFFLKAVVSFEQNLENIKDHLDEKVEEIQNNYDKTVHKIKQYYALLKQLISEETS